jgi:hypothetical protein
MVRRGVRPFQYSHVVFHKPIAANTRVKSKVDLCMSIMPWKKKK